MGSDTLLTYSMRPQNVEVTRKSKTFFGLCMLASKLAGLDLVGGRSGDRRLG